MKKSIYLVYLLSCLAAVSSCNNGRNAAVVSELSSTDEDALNSSNNPSDPLTFGTLIGFNFEGSPCLTVVGGQSANGSRLTLANCISDASQRFVQTSSNMVMAQNNMCLDVVDGRVNNGTSVQLWECDKKNANQKWVQGENGTLVWKDRNKCLDVVDGRTDTNAKLQIWDCDKDNKNQNWRLYPARGGALSYSTGTVLAEINNLDHTIISLPQRPTLATAGFSKQNIMSQWRPGHCLDIHDIETKPFVQHFQCSNNNRSQQFSMSSLGQITFPREDVILSGGVVKADSMCLSIGETEDTLTSIAVLNLCDANDSNQRWALIGNAIGNLGSQKCLGLEIWERTNDLVPLYPCTQAQNLGWIVGEPNEIIKALNADFATREAGFAKPSALRLIDRSQNSAGVRRTVAHFGGERKMLEWLLARQTANVNLMYQNAEQVRPSRTLEVIFDEFNSRGALYTRGYDDGHSEIFIRSAYFARDIETSFEPNLTHELTHVSQHSFYMIPGLVEGLAEWMARQGAGYGYWKEKTKGGSYKDGYANAMFFLIWLDQKYSGPQGSRPFTLKMNLQSHIAELANDPQWLTPWVAAQTGGKNLDQLWAEYQASF